ncbi:MAG: TonB-dependent receptor [Halioglobus sp.]|nr:TonB-dependent receptor [Halioglobus sp.]|tara:strand:- start:393 stop:2561 length:2169 start_codon:yes stop_codon:yes gene_type:complete
MSTIRTTAQRGAALAAALAALHTPHAAMADAAPTLEEIVVTASYRDTSLRDTPASISVMSSELITERAAQHLENILNAAPNVTFASAASRSRFVQVRGIGDLEQYYDPKYYPSVGLMLDELELGDSANAGMLFDVAQVEVLRGPQGTRYGSSAHAGMINIRSKRPTEHFEGELSGGVGNYDSYNLGLVLSGPLGDTLRSRVAVQQNRSDGYIDNKALGRDDSNDFDELTARGRLLWTPTDNADYELSAFYFDADNGHDAWSVDNNRNTYTDQPGHDSQETVAVSGSGNWVLGDALRAEAVLSYIDTDLSQSYDVDWVSAALCTEYTCSGGYDTAREIFHRDRERAVADLRLLGGPSTLAAGEGRYVLGLYANHSDEDFDYAYPSVWYGDFSSSSDYQTDRYALYGEYEYALGERLTLTGGLRYERFEDDYDNSNGFDSDNSEDLWNAELSAKYDLDDDSMVYITLARGAKPGGVNTNASANEPFMSPLFQDYIADNLVFDDETLLSTEVGLKTQQLDGRLSLNLALFYADRDNAQLENWMWDGDAGLWIGYLDSSSDATSYGAELEARFAATENIELFANLGWLETEVDSIDTFDLDVNDFVTRDGRDQAKSPNYQYNVGTRITFTDALSARLEVEGQDDSYFGYYHNGQLDSYDLVNASLQWSAGAFAVTLWGRNLGDEDYAVHGLYFAVDPRDEVGAWSNNTYTQLGEPRTYGLEVRYAF